MAIKKVTIEYVICDFCGKELLGSYLRIEDVPYEGCSTAKLGAATYDLDNKDFCNVECFVEHFKKGLGVDKGVGE